MEIPEYNSLNKNNIREKYIKNIIMNSSVS